MKEFFLLLIAILLFIPIGIVGLIFELIDNLFNLNSYMYQLAICIDKTGGVTCRSLFNHILIKSGSPCKFGSSRYTISYVLGKNKELGLLTPTGKWLSDVLHKIERNHVEKAVINNTKQIQ